MKILIPSQQTAASVDLTVTGAELFIQPTRQLQLGESITINKVGFNNAYSTINSTTAANSSALRLTPGAYRVNKSAAAGGQSGFGVNSSAV